MNNIEFTEQSERSVYSWLEKVTKILNALIQVFLYALITGCPIHFVVLINLNFTQEPPPIQPVISTPYPIPRNLRTVKKRSAISKFHDDYLACKREEAKLISDAIKEKSMRIVARDEKFSVTVAMDAFQELEGFDMADFVFATNLFIANARVCEAFMACKGERRAEWIKAMIEQHKAKQ